MDFDESLICNQSTKVLALNRNYFPIRVVTVRRALTMLVAGMIDVLDHGDGSYQAYEGGDWLRFSRQWWSSGECRQLYQWMRTSSSAVAIPKVIRTHLYDRLPPSSLKLNRQNIMMRDGQICQYCSRRLKPKEATLDHVIPRSRGGVMSWSNLVCCCPKCNAHKGDRTPEEAHMALIRPPRAPKIKDILVGHPKLDLDPVWKPFLENF